MLWHRLRLVTQAAKRARELQETERLSRDELLALQRQRLDQLFARVALTSRFYRQHWGATPGPTTTLADVPPLRRAALMEAFDQAVADPRLTRAGIEAHLASMGGDPLMYGEYRVMASSGSTGRPGLFVYDREAWVTFLASVLRWTRWMGVTARWPRLRTAAIGAPDAKHMTYRGATSLDVGLFRSLRLSATQPLAEIVDALNRHQPDALNAYPSIAELLAEEQRAGRLRIQPRVICTSSEQRTEGMSTRIAEAFGITPYDCYALTETGITAVDCSQHRGLHVMEDLCCIEVVDDDYRPVPAGTAGTRTLVTNLYNTTMPMVRVEVSDRLIEASEPCPCGLPLRLLSAVEGRSDDMLRLRTLAGGFQQVHPIHLRTRLAASRSVAQYRITFTPDEVLVEAIAAHGASVAEVEADLRHAFSGFFAEHGAVPLPLRTQLVTTLEREASAKLKVVRQLA